MTTPRMRSGVNPIIRSGGLRDEEPTWLDGLREGLAQGGVMGGLYSAAGVPPSNPWHQALMTPTRQIGRAIQGGLAGDPTFTTTAGQVDQQIAQQGAGLGLRAAEYNLQAQAAMREQEMMAELSGLDPTTAEGRNAAARTLMRYGHADKAMALLKQPAAQRPWTLPQGDNLVVIDPATGKPIEGFGGPRYKPTTNFNATLVQSDPLKAKLTIRKDFEAETRPYVDAAESAQLTIQAVDQATQSGNWLAAVEAVTRFAKATDPTTGVREGELAKFMGGGSIAQRFANARDQALSGTPTKETMQFMRDAAERIVSGVAPYYQARRKVYEELAASGGLDASFLGDVPQLNTPAQRVPLGDGKTLIRTPGKPDMVEEP